MDHTQQTTVQHSTNCRIPITNYVPLNSFPISDIIIVPTPTSAPSLPGRTILNMRIAKCQGFSTASIVAIHSLHVP